MKQKGNVLWFTDMNMKTSFPEVIFSQHILAIDNPFIHQKWSFCQHHDKIHNNISI